MKKIVCILLALLVLCGCSKEATEVSTNGQQNITTNGITVNGDEVSIEDIYADKHDSSKYWDCYVKVRNNYGKYIYCLQVHYKLIDKNGDVVDKSYITDTEIDGDEARYFRFQLNDSNGYRFDELDSIKFVSFEVLQKDPERQNGVLSECKGDLKTPVEYKIADIKDK